MAQAPSRFKQELLEDRRPRELRVQQYATVELSCQPWVQGQGWRKGREGDGGLYCITSNTYLRKYCNPTLRVSRNLGRNLDITLLGGSGGMAALELGNVWSSRSRRESNSEKRFRILKEEPCSWGKEGKRRSAESSNMSMMYVLCYQGSRS